MSEHRILQELLAAFSDGSPGRVAIVATAAGALLGENKLIQFAVPTWGSVDNVIVLPSPMPGKIVIIAGAATGGKLRSHDPVTVLISGGAEPASIAANQMVIAICESTTSWKAFGIAVDGSVDNVAGGPAYDPLVWFEASEAGVLLDVSDLSTLFQDSAGTTPVTADGDPVGRIADLSGNGNHFTASGSARPTYRTSGTSHWLEFDGTDDKMLCVNDIHPEDHTIVWGGSCDRSGPNDNRCLVGWDSDAIATFWGNVFSSAAALTFRGYASNIQSAALTYDSPCVISSRRTSANGTFRKDGTEVLASVDYAGTQVFDQLFAAGANVTGGRFYGLLVSTNVTEPLSEADAWMASKFTV